MVLQYHQHADSLPEREALAFLTPKSKLKSVVEVEKEEAEKEKAEKKKAEHKRYKAKKKAEAAAKREAEKKAEEVAEEVPEEAAEAREPPKSQAELQAEEDARLGDRRIQLQIARQERLDKAASLVRSGKDLSGVSEERVFSGGRKT